MKGSEIKIIFIRLLANLKMLNFEDISTAKLCVKTKEGYRSCKLFLINIELLCEYLNIIPSSREYRNGFTKNYKALFPNIDKRSYRVDVLEAAVDGYSLIWVNGEKFFFQPDVVAAGKDLHNQWQCIIVLILQFEDLLNKFEHKYENPESGNASRTVEISEIDYLELFQEWRSYIVSTLKLFDEYWTKFEDLYINNLIKIESISRRFVIDIYEFISNELTKNNSMVLDTHLYKYNNTQLNLNDSQEPLRFEFYCAKEFMSSYSRIISNPKFFFLLQKLFRVSNIERKGNEDVGQFINVKSWNLISYIDYMANQMNDPSYSIVGVISSICIDSLKQLIGEIVSLSQLPEKIDPHIFNNIHLHEFILKVQESWRIANKYLASSNIENIDLVKLVKFISYIFNVQLKIRNSHFSLSTQLPSTRLDGKLECINNYNNRNIFKENFLEYDIEAFLSLPKICCLLYLADPSENSSILKQFLSPLYSEYIPLTVGNKKITSQYGSRQKDYFHFYSIFRANTNDINHEKNSSDCKIKSKSLNNPIKDMTNCWNEVINHLKVSYDYNTPINTLSVSQFNKNFVRETADGKYFISNDDILLSYIVSKLTKTCLCGLVSKDNNVQCMYCNSLFESLKKTNFFEVSKEKLDALISTIELVSILLQRSYPTEWNEFMQITTLCIVDTPEPNSWKSPKNSAELDTSHKENNRSHFKGTIGNFINFASVIFNRLTSRNEVLENINNINDYQTLVSRQSVSNLIPKDIFENVSHSHIESSGLL
ncbi:uncharacterized protein CMU_035810 [Cryptosporidium muris RN66]|uniref:Uncharacterized protein n=1 Tax=Cryptosporidium muris (strain RN66) TaxID=441375 RepID=B6AGR7_CRYMR|nr:uncharacterized protein CMU_035810 [Cryptosporidium muris RN66]EEA07408.1 hypothetical protein, conserved [Cryptosporidium muris RN66]|eukprot:XP_002141757.1 hypothetical protein [Cryptosporidium muris RN66]